MSQPNVDALAAPRRPVARTARAAMASINDAGAGVGSGAGAGAGAGAGVRDAAEAARGRSLFELQPDEIVILDLRPPLFRSIAASSAAWLTLAGAILAAHLALPAGLFAGQKLLVPLALAAVLLPAARGIEAWARRRYLLTDRRVIALSGVLTEVINELPLTAVRRIEGASTGPQGLLGLGTLSFYPGRGSGVPVVWESIGDRTRIEATAREVIARYARGALDE